MLRKTFLDTSLLSSFTDLVNYFQSGSLHVPANKKLGLFFTHKMDKKFATSFLFENGQAVTENELRTSLPKSHTFSNYKIAVAYV